ncbi:hypothetical protein [Pseudonocardia broussonetiae]|uniref:Uncharacterized protein n=1 Tax=Pseudonocardia broussonetiae TaxID=2736640 RepID=A0A6M6JSI1_9PSEU|nr:hypothetical protein [Pseudonocardia broussonetiae]QJY49191.1 hypothetical protein HOP40_28395 [Pseudonocardia broussonetiae]
MSTTWYELRVNGTLSDRGRGAFHDLGVVTVPPQTIVFGQIDEMADLPELLALCSAMGLEIVSLRRLPEGGRRLPEGGGT